MFRLKKKNEPRWRPVRRKAGEIYHSEGTLKSVPGQYRILCVQVPRRAAVADPALEQTSHFYWCTYRDLPPRRRLGWRRSYPHSKSTLLFGGRLELRVEILQDAIAWE